jgi:CubicO group peptidase (beta-lactamase class C family)
LEVFFASSAPAWADHFPSNQEIESIIKQRVEEKRSSGIVVGVIEADGKTRVVAYGDPGPNAKPLGPKSVFEIGSISKTFTATLLAEMVARGEVKIDEPVQVYEHPGVTVPSHDGKQITLFNLATQNSGLPRMPNNFEPTYPPNPYADYTVDMLHAFLNGYTLPRDPGAKFEYSNLGVGLLGHVLAYKAGTDYETLVKTRVLMPLHMDMSGITLTPAMTIWLAKGHDNMGNVVPNWDLPTFAGAGALRSDMEDMLKYLAANIAEDDSELGRAMKEAHAVHSKAPGGPAIGYAWLTRVQGNDRIIWHNGGTGGYRTFIGFDPDRKVGAVVLANSNQGVDDIGNHLINANIPLAPKPLLPSERKEITLAPEILARYPGEYVFAADFAITIRLKDGQLSAQATKQSENPIFPESETDFFLKVVDAQITFTVDAAGKVTGFILHQNGANTPFKKSD